MAERVRKPEGKTDEQFDLARRRSSHSSLRSGLLWISVIARSVLCGIVTWTFYADPSALAGI
jgi:hypothetical protein